jgi:hypothetical protein
MSGEEEMWGRKGELGSLGGDDGVDSNFSSVGGTHDDSPRGDAFSSLFIYSFLQLQTLVRLIGLFFFFCFCDIAFYCVPRTRLSLFAQPTMSDQRLLGISASSDDAHHSSTPTPTSPLVNAATRTVAIIKTHAVDHRFEIEHRITEAKFEVRLSSSTTPFPRKSILL